MFRPNSLIAMSLAPELFDKSKALIHLKKAEQSLLSHFILGVSLLDPKDKMFDSV